MISENQGIAKTPISLQSVKLWTFSTLILISTLVSISHLEKLNFHCSFGGWIHMCFLDTVCLLFLNNYYCISQHSFFFFSCLQSQRSAFYKTFTHGEGMSQATLESSCRTKPLLKVLPIVRKTKANIIKRRHLNLFSLVCIQKAIWVILFSKSNSNCIYQPSGFASEGYFNCLVNSDQKAEWLKTTVFLRQINKLGRFHEDHT